MIPHTFEEWHTCITRDCKIHLTPEFAKERLAVYTDEHHPETTKFVSLYGEQHLTNIIHWFNKIK